MFAALPVGKVRTASTYRKEILMSNSTILQVSARLDSDKQWSTLFDILHDYGEELTAVWLKGEKELSLSFAEMTRRADDYAAWLTENTPEGGWIAISVDTCPNWPTLFWGVIRSGHNALLLDASATDTMTQSLLEEAGCKVIISRKPRGLSGDIKQIDYKAVADAPRTIGFNPVWGEYVAMCTSGTTGRSRIFAYSGPAVCEQALAAVQIHSENKRIIRDDNRGRKALAFLPFHHVLGFMANVILVPFCGATNVYLPDRTPNSIMNVCRHFPPNLLIVVPLVGNNLVKSLNKSVKKEKPYRRWLYKASTGVSLSVQSLAPSFGLRLAQQRLFAAIDAKMLGNEVDVVILGGSHTPAETLRSLNALGYYTVNGFGMTETAINGFETSLSLRKRLNGSVGSTLGSAQYRVNADEGAKTGELQIRGAGIHSGRVVQGEVLPPDTLEGGWFPTGDVAKMDDTGRVFIKGRLKDVIINESGENVYPDDLEDSFSALPGVEQMCIVGFRRRRKDRNEDVVLVLNVGENYTDTNYLNGLAARIAAINTRLPLNAHIDRALVTPMSLPLVSGIKVKRIELKRLWEEKELIYRELDLKAQNAGAEISAIEKEHTKSAVQDEIRKKVRAMYAEALDIPEKEITDKANFIE
ncbi:MAG: class I adenylate-forming enzyme family protein, partial [Clostridia bacterium]